ncbi:hypothetical protein FRC15_002585 [Serendipita sp. 397]|nr:hypothetical protein FRC15_002585 [Serendipita sp. 397]
MVHTPHYQTPYITPYIVHAPHHGPDDGGNNWPNLGVASPLQTIRAHPFHLNMRFLVMHLQDPNPLL